MNIPIPALPYQLFFEHRPDYLYAYVSCDDLNLDIAKDYWREIMSMLHRRRYKRVMLEKNVVERLPPEDVHKLVSELTRSGCSTMVFALVDQCYDQERAAFEESAGSRGGLNMKVFDDVRNAEKWMLSIDTHRLVYVQAAALATMAL